MEVYLIVPNNPRKIHSLLKQCEHLFSRQSERVYISSLVDRKCISVTHKIALRVGIGFSVNGNFEEAEDTIKFFKEHSWPNNLVLIFVVAVGVAKVVAKFFDPGCAFDAIPPDTIFRLKDVEVP